MEPTTEPTTTLAPLRVRPTLPPEIERPKRSRPLANGSRRPRREPSVRKLSNLSTRGRWMLAAGVAFALLPAVVSTLSAWHGGWIPAGDNALIGLRVSDVFSSHTPLIGQPSTSDLYGSFAANHPGPIEFWILAVPYQLFGAAGGLLVGAMIINVAAVTGVAFVAFRRQGLEFALWSLLLVTVMGWGLRANYFHDPISSNVATFTAIFLMYLMWSLWAGDWALLPLAAAVVSFVFQDHLSVLGQNALLAAAGVGGAVFLAWRRWGKERTDIMRWSGWAALVVAVLWAPVLIQQVTGHPGNLTAIMKSYSYNKGHAKGVGWAFDRLLTGMGPRPLFTRQFDEIGLNYLNAPHGAAARLLAMVPLVALVGLGGYAWYKKRHILLLLAGTAAVAIVSGFYSAMSLPATGGAELKPSAVRWMWTTGLFTWIVIGWLAWSLLVPLRTRRDAARWVAPGLAVAVVLVGLASTSTTSLSRERDSQYFAEIPKAMPGVLGHLRPGKAYVISMSGIDAGLTVGPAVAISLREHGHAVYGQNLFVRAFGEDHTYRKDGQVDGAVYVNDKGIRPPAPGAIIAAIIPNDKAKIGRVLHPSLNEAQVEVNRQGGVHLTAAGRKLVSDPSRAADDIDRALAVSLTSPKALLFSGLIAPAASRGYIETQGLDQKVLDRLRAVVVATKETPYVAVFYGPAPRPEPKKQ